MLEIMNNNTTDNTYIFHWGGGKDETLHGPTPEDALNRAGYGGGAVRALDYYEQVDTGATSDAAVRSGRAGGEE